MDIASMVITAVIAGGGAFLGAYLKKKAENLATHEDIEDLKNQTAVLTRTTEGIKAKISDEVWDRQARWSIKRDALFEVTRELATLMYGLARLDGLHIRMRHSTEPKNYQAEYEGAVVFWNESLLSFRRARALAVLVCNKDLRIKLDNADRLIGKTSDNIFWDTVDADSFGAIHTALEEIHVAMREELQIH
jgi:hypothetical protein